MPAADVPWFRFFVLSVEDTDGAILPACELPVEVTYKNISEAAARGLKTMCMGQDGRLNLTGSETSVAAAENAGFALLSAGENDRDVTVKFTDAGQLAFGTFAVEQAEVDAAIEAQKAAEAASEEALAESQAEGPAEPQEGMTEESAEIETGDESAAEPAEDESAEAPAEDESGEALPEEAEAEQGAETFNETQADYSYFTPSEALAKEQADNAEAYETLKTLRGIK
jgi:hypothetical protein